MIIDRSRQLFLLIVMIPFLGSSQIRVKDGMEVRIKEASTVTVTGDMEVQPTSLVNLKGDLSISGKLNHQAGSDKYILQSDAFSTGSLIVQGSITGDFTVERYLSSSTWHFLSPSVDNLTTSVFYYNGLPWTYAAYFDEPTSSWIFLAGTNDAMPLGQGFKFWLGEVKSSVVAEMKGPLISSDLAVNLSTSVSSWNLIGNPFPSAINWNQGAWGGNTNGTVYVWDSTYNGGDYRTWNGSTGDLSNGNIPISQSFFVYATSSGPFNIPAAARTHQGDEFYKSYQVSTSSFVRLQLSYEAYGNTLFIGFTENGSPYFDEYGDAYKIYSNAEQAQMYAMEQGEKLCINANAPLQDETRIIPVYLDQWQQGTYTLSISQLENLPHTEILLEDRVQGQWHDFTTYPDYIFEGELEGSSHRFNLHFKQEANQLPESHDTHPLLSVYSAHQNIYIRSEGNCQQEKGSVFIYNPMGQLCYQGSVQAQALFPISTLLPTGNYIVKVIKKSAQLSTKIRLL